MARQVETRLVDDLDGTEGAEMVQFAVDGKHYEIDLSEANAGKLRDALAPYVAAARRAGGTSSPRRAAPTSSRRDLTAARAWLSEHGYPVKERGRIPGVWLAEYDARTPNPPSQAVDEVVDQPAVPTPLFQAAAG